MLIVFDMENGTAAVRVPVATEAETCDVPPVALPPLAQPFNQLCLQENQPVSLGGLPAALPRYHLRLSLRV